MSEGLFADTNLLVYLHDGSEPTKRRIAQTWYEMMVRSRRLVVSLQILNEFYAVALRRFPSTPRADFRSFVDSLRPLCSAPYDISILDRARRVQDACGYRWYDCLIVASATVSGCRYLVTEDLDHQRSIDGLTIVNPFRIQPESLTLS
jgi:predicted nucleic acid-binding protein